MALRSVVDVDIDTGKLDAYQQKLDKIEQTKKRLAQSEGVQGQSAAGGAGRAGRQPGARGGQTQEERAVPFAERLARAWGTMREHSREVIRNVREMASRFVTITGLMGTLTAAATGFGFFGFDKLAERASNLRRTSTGLNTTPGRLMAARTEFGRFVDVDKWISHLRDVQLDPTKPGFAGIAALRGGKAPTRNEDTANLFADILPKFQEWAQRQQGRPGANQAIGLMANKIFGDISPDDLSRLLRMSKGEMAEAGGRFQQQTRIDIPDQTGRTFQDFITRVSEAGDSIQKHLINGLAPLAEPLAKLTAALTNLITSLMDKVLKPENLEAITAAIERFTKYIGSDQPQKDIQAFIGKIGEAVTALEGFVSFLKNFFGTAKNTVSGETGPAVTREEQSGTKPSIGGWGIGPDGKWQQFQGEKEQFGPPDTFLHWQPDQMGPPPPPDPLFRRKLPSALLHPSAYVSGGGGQGIPIVAARTIPVDIVGFGRFSEHKDKQPETPQALPMGGLLRNASFSMPGIANDNSVLGMIRRYESGGRNILNYRAAEDPAHFTASGYYQIIDSTWAEAKKMAGIPAGQYPHAMDAPYDEQTRAAQALLNARGLQPWETNEPLMKALRSMYLGGGADAGPDKASAPAQTTSQKPDFNPVKPPSVGVTIQNETGGNVVTTHRLLAT